MSFVNGPAQWRLPIGFQAFFALCLLLQGAVLPDSPRWLLAHGREEEALSVLCQLEDKPADHEDVIEKKREIEVSLMQESAGGTSSQRSYFRRSLSRMRMTGPFKYSELLERGPVDNFRRVCLAIGVNVMQQFTGSNMIKYAFPFPFRSRLVISDLRPTVISHRLFTRTRWDCQGTYRSYWAVPPRARTWLPRSSRSGYAKLFIGVLPVELTFG